MQNADIVTHFSLITRQFCAGVMRHMLALNTSFSSTHRFRPQIKLNTKPVPFTRACLVEPAVKESHKVQIVSLDYRATTLVLNKDGFRGFPVNDTTLGGSELTPNMPLITKYIPALDFFVESALLFLRPRRFGKSLTLSMLAHFMGCSTRRTIKSSSGYEAIAFPFHLFLFHTHCRLILPLCLQGLDVEKDVKAGNLTPGQYLMLGQQLRRPQGCGNFTQQNDQYRR
ncbi:hypothetical protein BC936DRAFT_143319 [Jimgerdemannia flammicorona]|uniref:AAA-ATPase-like domain-containing protein n=1 Tax=Jimgerdemannia flammicorona TaxID=994334 RepID=A0A433DE44_9FUNG|nr:hypothetical protein BC936DRAFT_143319 [Jimgerdemannia flammicorona]